MGITSVTWQSLVASREISFEFGIFAYSLKLFRMLHKSVKISCKHVSGERSLVFRESKRTSGVFCL